MSDKKPTLSRRAFLGARRRWSRCRIIVPASVFGRDGAVPPSERIVLGGIGIGNRGTGVLQLDAAGDGRAIRRDLRPAEAAPRGRQEAGGHPLRQQRLQAVRDMREFLATRTDIDAVLSATGDRWHATAAGHGHAGGQGRLLREAVGHDHRRGPGGRGDRPTLPADLPDRHPAAQRGQLHLRQRTAAARLPRQGPHRPGAHRPVGRRRDAARLAAGAAGASEGRGGLGPLAGPVSLAALQRRLLPGQLARPLRFPHELHRRMGRPHVRPVPGGARRCGRPRPSNTSTSTTTAATAWSRRSPTA